MSDLPAGMPPPIVLSADGSTLHAPLLLRYLSPVDADEPPRPGSFPTFLSVVDTGSSTRHANFMDLGVTIGPVLGASCSLYDKRREPCYAGLPLVRYPLAEDALDWRSKENCVVSAIIRRSHLCSSLAAFIDHTCEILEDMKLHHYSVKRIYLKTRSALRSRGFFFFTDDDHRPVASPPPPTKAHHWRDILGLLVRQGVFRVSPALQAELDHLGYMGGS